MLPADIPVLAAIFQASIEELTEDDYDDAQRAVWARQADDEAAFGAKLQACLTLVATVQSAPVGFVALEDNRHVAMLYVYPPVARSGIATLLCDAVETLARARGTKALTVDASDNARPFFEAKGFEAQSRQTVVLGDEWLGNTSMKKMLA